MLMGQPDEEYTLTAGRYGSLWLITGSMHKGLLVHGRTLGEALGRVEGAWIDLKRAEAEIASTIADTTE
jgi:hypothetical protein